MKPSPQESFGQLWSYKTEGWERFFDNWKDALKWQRLKPYEKFAESGIGVALLLIVGLRTRFH